MDTFEARIAEWRTYVTRDAAVGHHDVEELETHLRDQVDELVAAGLSTEEAFLVAVGRMGSVDELSREFAREHSGRLWKQLVLSDDDLDGPKRAQTGWLPALAFAVAAALVVQIVRLIAGFPDEGESWWLVRNASFFVWPFLAGYFAHRRRLDLKGWALTAAPFVLAAVVINLYSYRAESSTELL